MHSALSYAVNDFAWNRRRNTTTPVQERVGAACHGCRERKMNRTLRLLVVLAIPAAHASAPPAEDVAPEIHAERWLNPPPIRLYVQPKLYLLLFWESESRELTTFVGPLNRLHRQYADGRLMIVALTGESPRDAERAIRRHRMAFPVGAESRSARSYGVTRFPTLVIVDHSKRIPWRANAGEFDEAALRRTIESVLGRPSGLDRSRSRSIEEAADASLIQARTQEAERRIRETVERILASSTEPIGPEKLREIDDFYEQFLPSDPAHPAAPSENAVRSLALGADGATGFGALFKSGKLNDQAQAAVRDRLLSIAEDDEYARLDAVAALGRFAKPGDEVVRNGLGDLLAREPDPFVRGAIRQSMDRLDPTIPEADKALQHGRAIPLRNKLRNSTDADTGPLAEACRYAQEINSRSSRQLVTDYGELLRNRARAEDENALLMRLSAMEEIARRVSRPDPEIEPAALRSPLTDALGAEPDLGIRWSIVGALRALALNAASGERPAILLALEEHLNTETDGYFVRPRIEQALDELRRNP